MLAKQAWGKISEQVGAEPSSGQLASLPLALVSLDEEVTLN